MDFIEYINHWSKTEVIQAKIMIAIGALFVAAFVAILRSQNELLRGAMIPIGLIILVLVGYGSYILFSRPAHAKQSISVFESSQQEGLEKERAKHINDNKAGKTLMKFVYPSLILVSVLLLFFLPSAYGKGMALGFIVLFVATSAIDYGFVSRSDAFIQFIDSYK